MRFIHCSDLHLGRTLRERSLLDDQALILDQLAEGVTDPSVAAFLIAGDVYDRGVPPQDALGLLDRFLSRLKAMRPDLVIVIIPGNHDSAQRLAFGAGLFAGAGVHIRSKPVDCLNPIIVPGVANGAERIAIWTLPFLTPGCLPPNFGMEPEAQPSSAVPDLGGEFDFGGAASADEASALTYLRSQQDLMACAIDAMARRLNPADVNVVLAHCFARGASASESERAFLGAAEQVDASLFDRFDYAALGHLHRPQSAGLRGRYCGSPLAYSFDEAGQERGYLIVDAQKAACEIEFKPIVPLHALRRISGTFAQIREQAASDPARLDYIEVSLSDPEPVLNPVEALKTAYPNLLSVRQLAFESASTQEEAALPLRERDDTVSVLRDFAAFHKEVMGSEAEAASLDLVAQLVMEAERAPDQA